MSRSKNKHNRMRELHRLGAAAAQRYTGSSEFYYCPICHSPFDQSALDAGTLTLEHVPPKSLGGADLVLTCKCCDNTAGDSIDAAVSDREKLLHFAEGLARGTPGVSEDTTLQLGGERVYARVLRIPRQSWFLANLCEC